MIPAIRTCLYLAACSRNPGRLTELWSLSHLHGILDICWMLETLMTSAQYVAASVNRRTWLQPAWARPTKWTESLLRMLVMKVGRPELNPCDMFLNLFTSGSNLEQPPCWFDKCYQGMFCIAEQRHAGDQHGHIVGRQPCQHVLSQQVGRECHARDSQKWLIWVKSSALVTSASQQGQSLVGQFQCPVITNNEFAPIQMRA